MIKCQFEGCSDQATFHITPTGGVNLDDVVHLCERHAIVHLKKEEAEMRSAIGKIKALALAIANACPFVRDIGGEIESSDEKRG